MKIKLTCVMWKCVLLLSGVYEQYSTHTLPNHAELNVATQNRQLNNHMVVF